MEHLYGLICEANFSVEIILVFLRSWCKSLGISGEERCLTNIVKPTEELDDTLESKSGTSMSRCSILESIDVILNGRDRDAEGLSSLGKHLRVMHSLGTTGDLLSAHEEVIGVCIVGIIGVDHGVEGTCIDWVAVKHIEISVIFVFDETTEGFLGLSAQVLQGILLYSSLGEHGNTLLEAELEDWVGNLELLERILIIDD